MEAELFLFFAFAKELNLLLARVSRKKLHLQKAVSRLIKRLFQLGYELKRNLRSVLCFYEKMQLN